jgi:hypothetical protein
MKHVKWKKNDLYGIELGKKEDRKQKKMKNESKRERGAWC